MGLRPPKPEGYNWLMPYLTVSDAAASIAFYVKAFGFEPGPHIPGPDGKGIGLAEMKYKGATLFMLAPEGPWSPHKTPRHLRVDFPLSLYVYCEDVDALAARARIAGARVVTPPGNRFLGDRTARVEDLDGYQWTFATRIGGGEVGVAAGR